MAKARRTRTNAPAFFERVLAQLSERLATPTPDLPSVRCISRTSLKKILIQIRDQLAIPGYKTLSAKELIGHLVESRLLDPIGVRDARTGELVERFYAVGVGASAARIEPTELLMALDPRGVVCYFSAIQLYGLTTQIPSHHHVARLKDWGSSSTAAATGVLSSSSERSFNPLGTEQFTYEGVPYYTTHRDQALVPGVQVRHLSEKGLVRVTTLEQTLLDTLHRPLSCGGPAVIHEAWDAGLDRLNERRLVEYLERIADPALERRVGFLLEDRGYEPGQRLAARLDALRDTLVQSHPTDAIPLFQGYPGRYLADTWLVEIP